LSNKKCSKRYSLAKENEMSYRNIFIENSGKLTARDEQLVISQNEENTVPLEDINCIVVDNSSTVISTYLLSKIADHDIMFYVCNEKHLPTAMTLSINNYSRQLKRLEEQLLMPKPLKKRLWQSIIIKKIENQAKCLELLNVPGYERLNNLGLSVQSGDNTNVESTAAAYYFKLLYGNNFTRGNSCIINSALNYGYAIVRGMIARTLVTYGFETSIGLFHHSELNNFNLADDMIECFRPLVDLYITTNIPYNKTELTSDIKRIILNVTNQIVLIDNKKFNVQNAIEHMIMSLSTSIRQNENGIKLPSLIPLEEYRYE
jgi:CRISPR-associated protein Cas1